ncbi:MAG: DUF4276 family protein [Prevotellaceae bacterium]|jgi:hypothetical protein|nr:DUF4276 family protein [Prevotellaceae bacterium]
MNSTVIEILTEEASMENFLRVLLPRILPSDYTLGKNCFIRPHEGKSHLKKSIPIKMRAYPNYGYPVKVLILHDQDSNDCMQLKGELQALCTNSSIPLVVRIACRELENWYLGDLNAVETVYPRTKASRQRHVAKFREPDNVIGSHEMSLLTKDFSKSHASREIPKHMNLTVNTSASFNHFLSGLNKLIAL